MEPPSCGSKNGAVHPGKNQLQELGQNTLKAMRLISCPDRSEGYDQSPQCLADGTRSGHRRSLFLRGVEIDRRGVVERLVRDKADNEEYDGRQEDSQRPRVGRLEHIPCERVAAYAGKGSHCGGYPTNDPRVLLAQISVASVEPRVREGSESNPPGDQCNWQEGTRLDIAEHTEGADAGAGKD